MRKRFIFTEGASNKFWEIVRDGSSFTTIYGRVGSAGSATTKEFATEAECAAAAEKLISEKTKKGYQPVEAAEDSGSDGRMSESNFWNLIERARGNSEGDVETQCELLVEQLATRPVSDIFTFGQWLDEMLRRSGTSDLWAAAYIICGGCSDDSFEYFRAWLISRGQSTFERAVQDPESLARIIPVDATDEVEAESILGVASSAYQRKTGKSDYYQACPPITPSPPVEPEWEEDREELARMFPKLVERYWPE